MLEQINGAIPPDPELIRLRLIEEQVRVFILATEAAEFDVTDRIYEALAGLVGVEVKRGTAEPSLLDEVARFYAGEGTPR